MLLLIDNYDSFTWNLYQYFCELGADVRVKRNDEISLDEITALAPRQLVISPVPARPMKQAFLWLLFAISPVGCRFWGSVWGIRRSPRRLAHRWCVPVR